MARSRSVESYPEARARRERAQADLAELEAARLRGEYVRVDEVKEVVLRVVTAANARLGGIPAKWAPIVRPDDPVTARRHLKLAIEEVRSELRRLDFSQEAVDAAARADA